MVQNSIIPDSHKDLLERPIVVSLATVNPNGQPQVTPVWVDYDGTYVLINSVPGRQKAKNMEARPQVTVLAIDPDDTSRWMEVRGVIVQITEAGGADHIDQLSWRYDGKGFYTADPQRRIRETRAIFKIRPIHVIVDG